MEYYSAIKNNGFMKFLDKWVYLKDIILSAVTQSQKKSLDIQSFCKAKDIVNKTKRQPTDWERIFTSPKSDRELISNIYKELKKLDSRKLNSPIKKCGTKLKNSQLRNTGWLRIT